MSDDGDDLIELLKSGAPEIKNAGKAIVISIRDDDEPEVAQAKNNIQFVLNSSRDAVSMLSFLANETGNPKYFDSLSSMLRIMNEGNAQLIGLAKKLKETPSQSFNNKGGVVNHNTVNMTTEEVQALSKEGKTLSDILPRKTI